MNTVVWVAALLILYLLIIKQDQAKPDGHGFPVDSLPHPPEEFCGEAAALLFAGLLDLDFDPPCYFKAVEAPDFPYALLAQRNIACFALVTMTDEQQPDLRLLSFLNDGTLLLSGRELPLPSLKGCPWLILEDRDQESLAVWFEEFSRQLAMNAEAGKIPDHALVDGFSRKLGRLIDAWDELKITRLHTEASATDLESHDSLPETLVKDHDSQ